MVTNIWARFTALRVQREDQAFLLSTTEPDSSFLTNNDRMSTQKSLPFQNLAKKFFACGVRIWLLVIPSFVQCRKVNPSPTLQNIAPLDGLRGIACLAVFNFHFLFTYTMTPLRGFGAHIEGGHNRYFFQLPFICLLYRGRAMVALFFAISGYVLARRPIKHIRSGEWDKAAGSLASSAFRRGFRLYLPTIASTFIVMVLIQLGAFKRATSVKFDGHTLNGVNEEHPPYFEKFFDQLWDWLNFVAGLLDPWNWSVAYNLYDPHLWTIPLEFRSSMVLFLMILCLSKARSTYRLLLLALMIVTCAFCGRWEVTLFIGGAFIAEIDIINKTWETAAGGFESNSSYHLWICLLLGLYLLSFPDEFPQSTPGYSFLASWTPKSYSQLYQFWHSLGSLMFLWAFGNLRNLHVIFNNSLSQYLGRISYAFYIVHGPILHSLGYTIMPIIWNHTGKEDNMSYCIGFSVGWIILLSTSLWVADVFWRCVDMPCIIISRQVEKFIEPEHV